eukprot:TRINITY_DN6530_c0_g1_i3.p4 TRINITY_DN6530_c0_g1~~TRINITY_DN6530_c0_g1_i3.p4  ORF type:complete len:104 (-),score=0.44 TRINITY_DN6530_c0_g1_i3:731-1042(-)
MASIYDKQDRHYTYYYPQHPMLQVPVKKSDIIAYLSSYAQLTTFFQRKLRCKNSFFNNMIIIIQKKKNQTHKKTQFQHIIHQINIKLMFPKYQQSVHYLLTQA